MAVKVTGNITKHFTIDEYAVACPSSSTVVISAASMNFARLLEKFRVRKKRIMYVTSWFRTPAVNKKVGGIATSNHLTGTACDFHFSTPITQTEAIKCMKLWKEICEEGGVVGEAGLYPWGMHLGISHVGDKFVHWDSRSGKQINNPFKI